MTTKKPTHLIVTAGKSAGDSSLKQQLEKRAARFGTTTEASKPIADAEKLAARAARFADIKPTDGTVKKGSITTTTTTTDDKLAKRAARFADVRK